MRRLLGLFLILVLLCNSACGETLNVMVYDRGDMPIEYGTPVNNPWTRYLSEMCREKLGLEVSYPILLSCTMEASIPTM